MFAKLVLSKLVFLDGKLIISGPVIVSIMNQKKANKLLSSNQTNFKNRKKIALAG